MADVEHMKKIVPFVTCEYTFSQYVCELVFGVNVLVCRRNSSDKIYPGFTTLGILGEIENI